MENIPLSRRSVAFGLALAVACVVNAVIVVVKEKNAALLAEMKTLTGHHWTTHSIIVVVLFLGLGALFGARRGREGTMTANRLIATVMGGVGLATVIICGFYLWAD